MRRYPQGKKDRVRGPVGGHTRYAPAAPPGRRHRDEDSNYTTSDDDDVVDDENKTSKATPRHSPELKSLHRRITTIDWRAELCRILEISTELPDGDILEDLESALQELKDARLRYDSQSFVGPPRCEILHIVHCQRSKSATSPCRELCSAGENARDGVHLLGRAPVSNLELHLERNKDIAFIVYKEYECCGGNRSSKQLHDQYLDDPDDYSEFLKDESIVLVSEDMSDVLSILARYSFAESQHPAFDICTSRYTIRNEDSVSDNDSNRIAYPYLWWYHSRQKIKEGTDHVDQELMPYLSAFKNYIEARMLGEWDIVDKMLSKKRISSGYLRYIFPPKEIVISNPKSGPISELRGYEVQDTMTSLKDGQTIVEVMSWSFDGNFQSDFTTLPSLGMFPDTEVFDIKTLNYYPQKFARPEIVAGLRSRGIFFWKCRHRNYVSSKIDAEDDAQTSAESSRYMIDMKTYGRMHPDRGTTRKRDDLGTKMLDQDEPPLDDGFYMCLPIHIIGFNMQNKEWVKLEVHHLEDVRWNKKAFEYLVINKDTKELIRAVVSNQLSVQAKTDLIQGKGSGLFMLLHGGPGTGKTLTAESVAEIAQRPLYRVTCGDIGTKAEDVERYLASVLLLGTTWKCVVLLDEADIFLEQRSLLNLERNALVSVFLRVLEYYNGILILTSNRVGTFDEAFKSRIQLSLHYKNLDQHQRREIWKNFIGHLNEFQDSLEDGLTDLQRQTKVGYGIDVEDLKNNLEELSMAALNGRDIRNALSTARQLALYRKQPLKYSHLQIVMGEVQKFDDYLRDVHNGYTEDDIQRAKEAR